MEWKPKFGPRQILRWLWIYFLYCSGLTLWAKHRLRTSRGTIVLTLHRVLDDKDLSASNSPVGMVMRKQTFRNLLEYLQASCEVVSIADAPHLRETISNRPSVAITFDDGWKDTALVAFPMTRQRGIPIAVFVSPGLLGKSSPFWPERLIAIWKAASIDPVRKSQFTALCRSMGLGDMSSNGCWNPEALLAQLKALAVHARQAFMEAIDDLAKEWRDVESGDSMEATITELEMIDLCERGVLIGSHTQHHTILTQLPKPEVQTELIQSKQEIERILSQSCRFFAYPSGSWSLAVRQEVEKQGYASGFINEPGIWTKGTDQWLIPRVNISEGSIIGPFEEFSPAVFEYATYWRAFVLESERHKKV